MEHKTRVETHGYLRNSTFLLSFLVEITFTLGILVYEPLIHELPKA